MKSRWKLLAAIVALAVAAGVALAAPRFIGSEDPTPPETADAPAAPPSDCPSPRDGSARAADGAVVVSPAGQASARGTAEDPIDLATALSARSPVRPGGSILVEPGTYRGVFNSRLRGRPAAPITIAPARRGRVIIDGGSARVPTLTIRGSDTWFRDLEVTKSDPRRRTNRAGSKPADLSRAEADGIAVYGPRTKLINLVVHDAGNGIGLWRPALDAEVYGAITFNNGHAGPDRGWGHGIYVQNDSGTKRIMDVIAFNNFGFGVHGYAVNGSVSGVTVEGTTSFGNGTPYGQTFPNLFIGTERNPLDRISIVGNMLYHSPGAVGTNARLGFNVPTNRSLVVSRNVITGGAIALSVKQWRRAEVTDNLVYARPDSVENVVTALEFQRAAGDGRYDWDRNSYIAEPPGRSGDGTTFTILRGRGEQKLTFDGWQEASGLDARSTYSSKRPMRTQVFVRPNCYAEGRANITVFNWGGDRSVEVDLDRGNVPRGARFEIRDVQNFFGPPVVEAVNEDGKVTIPMTGDAVTSPISESRLPVKHTGREFGAFVLLPSSP